MNLRLSSGDRKTAETFTAGCLQGRGANGFRRLSVSICRRASPRHIGPNQLSGNKWRSLLMNLETGNTGRTPMGRVNSARPRAEVA